MLCRRIKFEVLFCFAYKVWENKQSIISPTIHIFGWFWRIRCVWYFSDGFYWTHVPSCFVSALAHLSVICVHIFSVCIFLQIKFECESDLSKLLHGFFNESTWTCQVAKFLSISAQLLCASCSAWQCFGFANRSVATITNQNSKGSFFRNRS